jgi:pyruvate dehydrogenase E1 component beta subunit
MVLTRAIDNRLKAFYTSGEVRYRGASVQGKGFRSLGQEAIYAAALRLRRGPSFHGADGSWRGDVVAPLIRDLGAALAMKRDDDAIRMALNAQVAKAGPPLEGKDLNIGDFGWGILTATAPLAVATLTIAGLAMAFWREQSSRVAVSFIGDGGASLGEWHEAINLCAVRRLPAIFCVQNNQRALSTPLGDQSAARVFADRAAGYGVPGITIDGTDPDEIAAAFAWAAERAREGLGPTLIELVSMRMCGHAHHDDMLYLGRDPQPSWDYPSLLPQGYADADAFAYWYARDPIVTYAARLEAEGLLEAGAVAELKREADARVEAQARVLIEAPWPEPFTAGVGVLAGEAPRAHREVLDSQVRLTPPRANWSELPPLETGPPFDPKGRTFLDAVSLAVGDALRADPRVFVYGEDVGGAYGNAFLLLRPLLKEFGDRLINSPIAEAGILGVCVGAALGGARPIVEVMTVNFSLLALDQIVNNAATLRHMSGGQLSIPLVVRMATGGGRQLAAQHSHSLENWYAHVPGLKVLAPATVQDARDMLLAALEDPDPVMVFEHQYLYPMEGDLDEEAPPASPWRAALRRPGRDVSLIAHGGSVPKALSAAERLAEAGVQAEVLDLRCLRPLDGEAILASVRRTHRAVLIDEAWRTGSLAAEVSARIMEGAFYDLDAPVARVCSAEVPIPYARHLEEAALPQAERIVDVVQGMVRRNG